MPERILCLFPKQSHASGSLRINLLQIGELAHNGLDEAFVQAHPEQPWRQIYGMRNRIVHDYEGIRLQIVWQTISEDFPLLIQDLKRLLADL